jgi:hypothetical protein
MGKKQPKREPDPARVQCHWCGEGRDKFNSVKMRDKWLCMNCDWVLNHEYVNRMAGDLLRGLAKTLNKDE